VVGLGSHDKRRAHMGDMGIGISNYYSNLTVEETETQKLRDFLNSP
jgi:hypothetical protein